MSAIVPPLLVEISAAPAIKPSAKIELRGLKDDFDAQRYRRELTGLDAVKVPTNQHLANEREVRRRCVQENKKQAKTKGRLYVCP